MQVHTILEQPSISCSHILDSPVFAWQPVEVTAGPVIDPSFNVSLDGPMLHADRVVKDIVRKLEHRSYFSLIFSPTDTPFSLSLATFSIHIQPDKLYSPFPLVVVVASSLT